MSSVSSDSSDDSDATITEEVVLGRSKPRAAGSIHRIGKPELPLTRVKHSIELQMVAPLGVYTRVRVLINIKGVFLPCLKSIFDK